MVLFAVQRGFETLVGSGVYQFWGATAEQVVDDAFCSLQRGFETSVGNGVYQFWGAAAEQVVDDALRDHSFYFLCDSGLVIKAL